MTAFGEACFGEFFFEEPPTVFLSYQMLSRIMIRNQADWNISSSIQQSFKVSHSFETRLVFQRRIAHGLSQILVIRETAAYGLETRITRWPRSPVLKAPVEHKAIRIRDAAPEKVDLNRYMTDHSILEEPKDSKAVRVDDQTPEKTDLGKYKTDHKAEDGSWQI